MALMQHCRFAWWPKLPLWLHHLRSQLAAVFSKNLLNSCCTFSTLTKQQTDTAKPLIWHALLFGFVLVWAPCMVTVLWTIVRTVFLGQTMQQLCITCDRASPIWDFFRPILIPIFVDRKIWYKLLSAAPLFLRGCHSIYFLNQSQICMWRFFSERFVSPPQFKPGISHALNPKIWYIGRY